MSLFLLLLKAIIVLYFLLNFIRRSTLVWGIGLLTVTTATLLDAFFGSFGRDQAISTLGFYFYCIAGGLLAGSALWLWGILRPQVIGLGRARSDPGPFMDSTSDPLLANPDLSRLSADNRALLDHMIQNLVPQEILDVAYDLEISENKIVGINEPMTAVIERLMAIAEKSGQTSELTLAIDRILKPLPPEALPRLEKLSIDSPPAVLRHYLLANFNDNQLSEMAGFLGIIWGDLPGDSKQARTRNLLLRLKRQERLSELLALLKKNTVD